MSDSPVIITRRDELEALCRRLAAQPVVALDLEADSMHHYREKVCLIQVAVPSEAVLIDPLVLQDVSPLGPVLSDPAIRKVFHGADYDIRSLYRDFRLEVTNLFDTMVASQFLGEREVGLSALLRKRFGVELDKRYQKADWSRRPLTEGMIAYAMEDTRLLIPLQQQLSEELAEAGRLGWVEEDCALLSRVRPALREEGPLFLRFKGAQLMDRRSLGLLEGLLQYRDRRARERDLPPFKVMGNDLLREIALRKPATAESLAEVPGFGGRIAERHGAAVSRLLREVWSEPEERLPRYPLSPRTKKDPRKEQLLKKLKEWRQGKAEELRMEPGILANNALLEAFTDAALGAEGEAAKNLRTWQEREVVPEIVAVIEEWRRRS